MAKPQVHLAALLLLTLTLGGCGHTKVEVPNQQAFDQAISAYFKRKNMGLKVFEYRLFEQQGENSATAHVAVMAADEGASQAKVQFIFQFTRQGSSWKVKSHRKK